MFQSEGKLGSPSGTHCGQAQQAACHLAKRGLRHPRSVSHPCLCHLMFTGSTRTQTKRSHQDRRSEGTVAGGDPCLFCPRGSVELQAEYSSFGSCQQIHLSWVYKFNLGEGTAALSVQIVLIGLPIQFGDPITVCVSSTKDCQMVSPHTTLRMLREKLGEYLGGVAVADKFQFLKCIGKKLAVVKAKQEAELKIKSFAPPYALYPELYLLPQVEYFEDVYPLSSSTQQRHHFNAETNRYGHGSRLPNLPQQKTESKQFLESIQSSHQLENQKVYSPAEWSEKESLPVLHTSHEQDHNRITETQTQFREQDQIGSKGSLFTPSPLNPADQGTGKSCIVQKNSQHNHLSQDPKEPHAPKWNDKAKGTALTLHVNHSDEQDQDNQTHQNLMTYPKEPNSRLITNVENNDHQKDGTLRGDRTQHSGILRTLEDQTTEYIHKNQRLLPYRTSKSVTIVGENLDDQANENNQSDPTYPKEYASPPSLPLLAISVSPAQVPAVQAEKNEMVEQLEQMKKDRRLMEKNREELVKKVKTLLEQNKLKRYHDREEWKKKYFETKKATVSLENVLSKLRQDLELCHQKLLLQLEARDSRKQSNNTTNLKNNRIIQITTAQHELDQLKRKLDGTKMKLVIEIKMRKQAIADLRALRAELMQKKTHSALILQSGKSGI